MAIDTTSAGLAKTAAMKCMEQVSADKAGFRIAQPQTPKDGWVRLSAIVEDVKRGLDGWLAEACSMRRLSDVERAHSKAIFDRIHRAYLTGCIPIHALESGTNSAQELFQIFIRLNSAGTPLGAAEQFFAGVKQHWLEAEERLAPLARFSGPLERRDLITLVARAAAKVPLNGSVCHGYQRQRLTEIGGRPHSHSPRTTGQGTLGGHPQTGIRHNLLILKMDAVTRADSQLTRRRHAMVYKPSTTTAPWHPWYLLGELERGCCVGAGYVESTRARRDDTRVCRSAPALLFLDIRRRFTLRRQTQV